ncbi:MAG: alcohol dehydrogenase catalytic domain-containing protein [Acidobacteriota bacterium]
MKAVVYHGQEDMRVENVADPGLQHSEDVLVRVEKTAICGSDLHLWHSEPFADPGFVVGHEFLGTIEDVGKDVRGVSKGDRVIVSCTNGCGRCPACKRGVFSGCPVATEEFTHGNIFGFGSHLNGGQAEAVRVPFGDANCFHLPDELEDEDCLFLTDILPTGYMGAEMANVGPGDTVVVFGCGPVGTFAQMSARLRGAARVIAVDLDAGRLARAEARGCIGINPREEDVLERVLELTHGEGAHASIEAVGRPELVTQAAMATRPGGVVSVIGVILQPFQIEWALFLSKNLSLRTGLVNPQAYVDRLIPLIREGHLDPAQIVSHRYSLDDAVEGYETFAGHRDDVLKVVLSA